MEAFVIKNHSIYKCSNCKKISEVVVSPDVYRSLWIVQISAIIIFMASILLGEQFTLVGLIIMLLIYGMFYALIPYMIYLSKPTFLKREIPWYKRLIKKLKGKENYGSSKIRNNAGSKHFKHMDDGRKKDNVTDKNTDRPKEKKDDKVQNKNQDSRDIFSS